MLDALWHNLPVSVAPDGLLRVGNNDVVHPNERHILGELVKELPLGHNVDVLEIGFGLGISATEIQMRGCRSHTIIEAHPVIANNAREWAKFQPHPVSVHQGYWQEELVKLGGRFDAILFDSFGDPPVLFVALAAEMLRPGGYLVAWNDSDPFDSVLLGALLSNFDETRLRVVENRSPCASWSASRMIFPVCRKRL